MRFSFWLTEKLREEQGLSFIEVMISMAILSFGILAVAQMQASTVRNTTNGNVLTLATMLAHSHLEQIKNTNDVSDLDDPSHPLVVTQQFDEQGNPDANGLYQITTVVAAPAAPINTLTRDVAVTVSWSRMWGANRRVTLRTITHGNGV
jgi:prepilin-type N-terminal cleavage/methylation domain-containing protein